MGNIGELLKDRVKRLRIAAGYTQVTLGNLVGVSKDHIKNIESGRKGVSPETLRALADAFGVTMEELLHGENVSVKPQPKSFSAGEMTSYIGSIPSDIYELALKLGNPNDPQWEYVRAALEVGIEREEKKRNKAKHA